MDEIAENKRISQIKQQVLNPKGPAPMMTGAKYVGMMNELVLKKEFVDKDEWEKFYYESGAERFTKINNFIKEKREELRKKGSKRKDVPKSWIAKFIKENNLEEGYGRTEEELNKLGEKLYKSIPERIIPTYEKYIKTAKEITIEDCKNYLKEVVIDTTWVGEIKRALNVIKSLKKIGITDFVKTSGDIDVRTSVDYEKILKKGKIGLQIKPEGFEPVINKYNKIAQRKFEGKVFTIKADKEGEIKNKNIIDDIKKEIEELS